MATPQVATPQVAVTSEPLDADALIALVGAQGDGAVVTFAGLVRDHNQGRRVRFLEYDAYEPLAVRALQRIVAEAAELWPSARLATHHRIGRLEIGEASVLIAVSAAHRGDAFEACRYAIDTLKRTVPVWKKEHFEDGEVWVGLQGG